jgi:hypothetical protein
MALKAISLAAAVALVATAANATTYTFTADEFNGDGSNGPSLISSWNIVLGAGESIVSAIFESTFGNSVISNSADGTVTVGGITVATCAAAEPCYTSLVPTPISYSFDLLEFASLLGPVDLIYTQDTCCVIRLGPSTLTIVTEASVVPLPAAGFMLFGALGGLALLRRRKTT